MINIWVDLKKVLPDLPADYAVPVKEYAIDPIGSKDCPPLNIVIFIVGSRGESKVPNPAHEVQAMFSHTFRLHSDSSNPMVTEFGLLLTLTSGTSWSTVMSVCQGRRRRTEHLSRGDWSTSMLGVTQKSSWRTWSRVSQIRITSAEIFRSWFITWLGELDERGYLVQTQHDEDHARRLLPFHLFP